MSRRRAERGWRGHLRLMKRRHVPRERIVAFEVVERQPCRVFGGRPSGEQLTVAIVQVLRELVDDFDLPRRRKAQGGQPRTHLARPQRSSHRVARRPRRVRHVRLP
jgi:hypothetical protein